MRLSVVVPAYNEQGRLGQTVDAVREYFRTQPWDWELRVVDDGSSDRTGEIAESHAALDPRIRVMREPHRGKGGAVKAGLMAAQGDFRFICDADLSMPMKEIHRFLPPTLEDVDVAIATREGPDARRLGEPLYRHAVGRIFNLGVQSLVLPGINDSQCGFKMFTAAAVNRIFPRVTVSGWAFDVEVLAIARAQGLRIVEVPIEWHYRAESRLSLWRDGAAMFAELMRIRWRVASGAYGKRASTASELKDSTDRRAVT
jgi:glycosyltransferase involved in cell wall biosynthesis